MFDRQKKNIKDEMNQVGKEYNLDLRVSVHGYTYRCKIASRRLNRYI